MKKFLSIIVILAVAACGFEPLYVQKKNSGMWYFGGEFDNSISAELSQVKVEPIAERFGQQVRNQLIDILSPLGSPRQPKYRLYVYLAQKQVIQQALRADITATREKVIYKVTYNMVEGDKEVLNGDSLAYVGYDVLANPYSTTIARKKTEEDAAKILANDIALRLGAYFHTKLTGKGNPSDFQTGTDR